MPPSKQFDLDPITGADQPGPNLVTPTAAPTSPPLGSAPPPITQLGLQSNYWRDQTAKIGKPSQALDSLGPLLNQKTADLWNRIMGGPIDPIKVEVPQRASGAAAFAPPVNDLIYRGENPMFHLFDSDEPTVAARTANGPDDHAAPIDAALQPSPASKPDDHGAQAPDNTGPAEDVTVSGSLVNSATPAGRGVVSTLTNRNGAQYIVIRPTNFDYSRSNHRTVMAPSTVMAAAADAAGVNVVRTRGPTEKGGFVVPGPDGLPMVIEAPGSTSHGNGEDIFSFGLPSQWPTNVKALTHGHIDGQSVGMVDAPTRETPYGDTRSLDLSHAIPTATEYKGQVGWHMLVDGQLEFMYPLDAVSPSQAARIQKNLDAEQLRFYKK